jgi:hypothetical protein
MRFTSASLKGCDMRSISPLKSCEQYLLTSAVRRLACALAGERDALEHQKDAFQLGANSDVGKAHDVRVRNAIQDLQR